MKKIRYSNGLNRKQLYIVLKICNYPLFPHLQELSSLHEDRNLMINGDSFHRTQLHRCNWLEIFDSDFVLKIYYEKNLNHQYHQRSLWMRYRAKCHFLSVGVFILRKQKQKVVTFVSHSHMGRGDHGLIKRSMRALATQKGSAHIGIVSKKGQNISIC